MDVEEKGTTQNVDTKGTVVVETADEEEQAETEKYRIYNKIQRHQTARYEPKSKWKRYEYGAMLLNFEGTLESTIIEADYIEHILGIILDQKYSLKVILKSFREKG